MTLEEIVQQGTEAIFTLTQNTQTLQTPLTCETWRRSEKACGSFPVRVISLFFCLWRGTWNTSQHIIRARLHQAKEAP